jgi:hypothetical protein
MLSFDRRKSYVTISKISTIHFLRFYPYLKKYLKPLRLSAKMIAMGRDLSDFTGNMYTALA